MKKKIIGTFVCMMFVVVPVLSAATFSNNETTMNGKVRNTVTETLADPNGASGLNLNILSAANQANQQNNQQPLDIQDLQFYYDVGGDSGSPCLVGFGFDGEYFYAPESESSKIHKFESDGTYIGYFLISDWNIE